MLRIVPSSAEELRRVQELQDLEELQVLGAAGWGGGVFAPPLLFSLALHPQNRAGVAVG